MNLSKSHVLITGGSDGIGKALAKKFIDCGSRVIVTGRDQHKLHAAADEIPGLEIFVNDIGMERERERLAFFVHSNMRELNILINNAGIQRRIGLATDNSRWSERQAEIDILFSAPVHLNHLLIPTILAHGNSSLIVNVTSGGAYIPQIFAPIYSACKAAIRSYTQTLRDSLTNTSCRVAELIPPAVRTKLAGENIQHGVALADFVDSVFKKLFIDEEIEVGFGATENLSVQINGVPSNVAFRESVERFTIERYPNSTG